MSRSEDELLSAIRKVLSGPGPGVLVGVGDDAAVTVPGSGALVLTADMLVEGVHFDRSTASARDIGYKAVAVNASDIAAMGASPRFALASIALSDEVDDGWTMELFGGMREAADEDAVSIVGGDLVHAERVACSLAMVGEAAPGRVVTRAGAQPGDVVVVTGSVGGAAGGLRLAGSPSGVSAAGSAWARELSLAYLRPRARVGEGQMLAAAGASAMIDVSDGLTLDLARLCEASKVGARLEIGAVPVSRSLVEGAEVLGVDPLDLALGGGDDYELIATLPADRAAPAVEALDERFGTTLTMIGVVTGGEGLESVDASGATRRLEPHGWDPFADREHGP